MLQQRQGKSLNISCTVRYLFQINQQLIVRIFVYLNYTFKFKAKFYGFLTFMLCNIFAADATMYRRFIFSFVLLMKTGNNCPQKQHILVYLQKFSGRPTGLKPAPVSNYMFNKNGSQRELCIMTLGKAQLRRGARFHFQLINALVHPSRHVIIYAIIIISEIHLGNARSGFLALAALAAVRRRRPIYDHPDFFPAIENLACPQLEKICIVKVAESVHFCPADPSTIWLTLHINRTKIEFTVCYTRQID